MRYVISDIHGCYKTFHKLLSRIDYTKLFLLGDYIDRGPDSKKVVDYLMKHPEIKCLTGNHEQMLIHSNDDASSRLHFIQNGGIATLESFDVKSPEEIPSKYFKWIKTLKHIFILKDYYLVHGGLNFSIPNPLEDSEDNKNTMLWDRNSSYQSDFLEKKKKRLCVGHTPKRLEVIKESLNHRKVFIDGGCAYKSRGYGYLVAFNLDTNEIVTQNNIE